MPELSKQGVRTVPEGVVPPLHSGGEVLSSVDPVPEVSEKLTRRCLVHKVGDGCLGIWKSITADFSDPVISHRQDGFIIF